MAQTNTDATFKMQKDLRVFSWRYWSMLTIVVAAAASYFYRKTMQLKAVSITPTPTLDARFGFTPAEAHQTLRDIGPKGRGIYRAVNMVDFILAPLVFRSYFLNTLPATSSQREAVRELIMNAYFMGDLWEN